MIITKRKTIFFIILLFTALQFLILYIFKYTPYPDCGGYIKLAKECISQGQYLYPTEIQIKELPFIWNLGSINILIFSLRFFDSITPVLILYSLMKGCTALFVYLISKKLTNKKTAIISLLIYVLYPANYGESTSVLSELPFIFFNLAGISLALYNKHFFCGMLMAVGNWFRPMSMIFLISTILYLLWNKSSKKILTTLLGYIISIMIIGGVHFIYSGKFIFQAKTGWMALMQYSWDNDKERSQDYALFEKSDPMYCDESKLDCVEKDLLWRSNFIIWLKNNVFEYFRQIPEKFVRMYVSDNVNFCTFIKDKNKKEYMYEELSMESLIKDFPSYSFAQILTFINLIYYYVLLILFVIGTIFFYKRKSLGSMIMPISLVFVGTIVILLAGHGESRFHIPFMPFIIMTVAYYISTKTINNARI